MEGQPPAGPAPLWHSQTTDQILKELGTGVNGLSSQEAAHRFERYGPNALTPPKKPGFFAKLWAQLNNVLIFILLAAAVVVAGLQEWIEFGLILAVVTINVLIGMVQEGKAEKAAEAIKAMLSASATVLRDGKRISIDADQLVPGDVVFIKSGDKVPADLRMLQVTNLQVQEAMLTGESMPVSKNLSPAPERAGLGDRKCLAYSATSVSSGQGLGVVVATGDAAEIGQINKMVSEVDNVKTNLLVQMEILGRWLAIVVVAIAVGAFLLALLRAKEPFVDAFESAVAIAVAMIPEGLPALVTIVLALGTKKMADHNAIIRQLPCVETLGSLTVICSDKTGTLTKNEMTAVAVQSAGARYSISGVGYEPKGGFTRDGQPVTTGDMSSVAALLEGCMLCNDSHLHQETLPDGRQAWLPNGAPTEVALITAGLKAGLKLDALTAAKPRIASVPFESEHKFMATVHQAGPPSSSGTGTSRRIMYVKGAPDRLLPMCSGQLAGNGGGSAAAAAAADLAPLDVEFWQRAQEELSSQGLRVLALCRGELGPEEDLALLNPQALLQRPPSLAFVALIAILDPPREEAVTSIKEAHRAGINVKMITGDHALTAVSIGRMLGISGDRNLVLTGPEVDKMSDEELQDRAMDCNIYARASPENKLRIVRALQARRQVVSMTGDGVNDAPALKAADVGVAMGITGTDVSKEAAKMLLADDNFASIVAAVREGRRVWDNIRKILIFNMPVNVAQGMSVVYAFILGFTSAPLTALQVLLVNLVTAVTLGLALAAEPPEPTVMERPPRRPNKHLVGKLLVWRMLFVSHILVVLVVGSFYWGGQQSLDLEQRRAEAFNVLVGGQVAYFVTCRFLKTSTVHLRVFKGNLMALLSVTFIVALMVFVTYVPGVNHFFHMAPMIGIQWARVVVCVVIVYVVVEVEKALVDPLLMPMMRPVLRWIDAHVPSCLSFEWRPPAMPRVSNAAAQLCRKPAVKGDALDGGANGATAT